MANSRFTYTQEGHNSGPYNSRVLHYPEGSSGVTIGRGYDMKLRSEAEIVSDLISVGIDRPRAIDFAHGAKLTGSAARQFVNDNKDRLGEITESQQEMLFEKIYPEYERRAERFYNQHTADLENRVSWDELDSHLREVLVDTVYQGLARKSTYRAAASNNPEELKQNIISRSDRRFESRNRNRFNHMGVGN